MSSVTLDSSIARIGETAGLVWQTLHARGPLALSRLVAEVDAPRDLVMQALGWLAREDKITIDSSARGRIVALK